MYLPFIDIPTSDALMWNECYPAHIHAHIIALISSYPVK